MRGCGNDGDEDDEGDGGEVEEGGGGEMQLRGKLEKLWLE